jgi:hypothetical protein
MCDKKKAVKSTQKKPYAPKSREWIGEPAYDSLDDLIASLEDSDELRLLAEFEARHGSLDAMLRNER